MHAVCTAQHHMTETDPSPKDDGIPHRSSISHLACVRWVGSRERDPNPPRACRQSKPGRSACRRTRHLLVLTGAPHHHRTRKPQNHMGRLGRSHPAHSAGPRDGPLRSGMVPEWAKTALGKEGAERGQPCHWPRGTQPRPRIRR